MSDVFDVEMPDGTIIQGVPQGTTQADLQKKLTLKSQVEATPTVAGIPQFAAGEGEPALPIAQVRQGQLERSQDISNIPLIPDPIERVAAAAIKPFKETDFGLSQEFIDKFKGTPGGVLDTFNQIILEQGVSPVVAVLQGVIATGEGAIDAFTQGLQESGASPTQAKSAGRDLRLLEQIIPLAALRNPRLLASKINEVKRIPDDEAERILAGKQLEVPLSKGDIKQDVTQQAFEDRALKGLEGPQAQQRIEAFRGEQDVALRGNVQEMTRKKAY